MSELFSTENKYKKKSKVIEDLIEKTISIGVLMRVSTDFQAEDGDSLEMQLELAKKHEKEIKGVIYKKYIEEGVSASKTRIEKREAIQELIQDIRDGKINYVIAYKRDRMFRNSMEYISFIQLLADYNVELYLTATGEQQVDLEAFKFSGASKMMEVIMSMVSEMESATTATRVSDTMIMKAKKGEYTGGSLPIGYTFGEGEFRFELIDGAREVIKLVEDLYIEGHGLLSIAKYLNGAKIKGKEPLESPVQKPIRQEELTTNEWHHRNIYTILFNPIYTGHFSYDSKMNADMARQIRENKLIEVCRTKERQLQLNKIHQQRSSKTSTGGGRLPLSTTFLLSGLLFCSECGQSLITTTTQPKGVKNKFSYYSCRGKRTYRKVDCEHKTLYRKEVVEKIVVDVAKEKIKYFLTPEVIERAKLKLDEDKFTYSSEADKVAKDIKKLQIKLDNISDLVSELEDDLDLQIVYLKKQKTMLNEINDLKEVYARLEEKSNQDIEDNFDLEEFIGLAEKFGSVFDDAPIGIKKQMLNGLFSNIHINKKGDIQMKLKIGLVDFQNDEINGDATSDDSQEVIEIGTGVSPMVISSQNVLNSNIATFDIYVNYHDIVRKQAENVSSIFLNFVDGIDKLANPNNDNLFIKSLDSQEAKKYKDLSGKAKSMFRSYFITEYKSTHYISKNIQEIGYTFAGMKSFLSKHELIFDDFFEYLHNECDYEMNEDYLNYLLKSKLATKDRMHKFTDVYYFKGKIKCSNCGGKYLRTYSKKARYGCTNRMRSIKYCDTKSYTISQEDIFDVLYKDIGDVTLSKEELVELIDEIRINKEGEFEIKYKNRYN